MDKYEASNGVTLDAHGLATTEPGYGLLTELFNAEKAHAARIEFYQALRDEELGRWRWPEEPDYYARRVSKDEVGVTHEPTGRYHIVRMGGAWEFSSPFRSVAQAFLEAHPERKPWEDANEGEVWIITPSKAYTLGEQINYPAIFQAGMFRDHGGSWLAEDLTAARRIWPEES